MYISWEHMCVLPLFGWNSETNLCVAHGPPDSRNPVLTALRKLLGQTEQEATNSSLPSVYKHVSVCAWQELGQAHTTSSSLGIPGLTW